MIKLTSREHLHRCYYHQETDRPGIYVRGLGSRNDPSYQALTEFALEKTDLKQRYNGGIFVNPPEFTVRQEDYDQDFTRVIHTLRTPAGPLEKTSMAGKRGQPGLHETYLLKDAADAEKYLSQPFPEISGDTGSFFEIRKKLGERGIVEISLGMNPGGTVAELFGSENFAIMSMDNREMIHRLLEYECKNKILLAKYLLAQGLGPYFSMLGEEYIVPPLHGRRDFFDFNVRYDRRITDIIHEAKGRIHIHSHGSVKTVLDGFIELGADVLHPFEAPPMGDITPREAKTVVRGKLTMEGNLQIADLYESTPGNIRAQTEALVRDAFDDHRGLIVCPTASPYLPGEGEKCIANYMVMINTVLSYSWT